MPCSSSSSYSNTFGKILAEEELNEECRELLSSLPKEKGWLASNLYQYQGFWYTSTHLQGIFPCQKHFQAQDSDIFLVTIPKAGTTWLKAFVFAILNQARYPFTQEHPLLHTNSHDLVPFLEIKYIQNPTPVFSAMSPQGRRLLSSHLPVVSLPESVRDSACKIVYLYRDPKDTVVSLWHFTNKLRPQNLGHTSFEERFDMFCRGVSAFGPFWDHVSGYLKESLERPQKVLFLKYEEMKERPAFCLRRLAEFLEHPFSPEEEISGVLNDISRLCCFDNMSKLEVNKSKETNYNAIFRKGKVGDWRNYLSADMADKIDQITKRKLLDFS